MSALHCVAGINLYTKKFLMLFSMLGGVACYIYYFSKREKNWGTEVFLGYNSSLHNM